uniref:Transcription factor 24 n=1 Tax=Buteo japonicus TaxID=224669 RepID=A0A8C0B0A7_9AVES
SSERKGGSHSCMPTFPVMGSARAEPDPLLPSAAGSNSCPPSAAGQRAGAPPGRPAAANAARERSRVQTLRHAFLELQKTLPSVPPDTKLSKLDVLLLATTYIAHLTRSLQDEEESPGEALGTLRGDGYLHPVKVGELGSSYQGSSRVPAPPRSPPGNLGDPPPSPWGPAVGDVCGGGDALSRSGDPSRSRAGFSSPAEAAEV